MREYTKLIRDIMKYGTDRPDRTGIGSRYIFGQQFAIDMEYGFPATTVRPVPLRWAFEETMFFLRGERQTKKLEDKGITIWKGNTTREFLDKRGMGEFEEGDMGYGYGWQWRNFNGVPGVRIGVDQINQLVKRMTSNPDCRRHIVSAWNPKQLEHTALPPCHILQQHDICDGRLNTLFWMRSNDVMYGLPFNIVQYAFINLFFAKLLNLKQGKLVYQCGNSHIYANQFDMANEVGAREPKPLPFVDVNVPLNSLDDILALEWENIIVEDYHPLPDIKDKPPMAV